MCCREKYPDIKKLSTWFFTISANIAKTELRRRKRWHSVFIHNEKHAEHTKLFQPLMPKLAKSKSNQSS